jgi:hypothetical protein
MDETKDTGSVATKAARPFLFLLFEATSTAALCCKFRSFLFFDFGEVKREGQERQRKKLQSRYVLLLGVLRQHNEFYVIRRTHKRGTLAGLAAVCGFLCVIVRGLGAESVRVGLVGSFAINDLAGKWFILKGAIHVA